MIDENSKVVEEDATDGRCCPVSGDVCDPTTASVAKGQDPAFASSLGSAGNALRHGLTAQAALPKALRLRTEHFLAELRDQLKPAGCLENVLVDEIARHAAGMELAGDAEGAILRYCGQQRSQLDAMLDPAGSSDADACFTAAIANQPIERLGRYQRLHERGFYTAFGRLQDLQAARHESAARASVRKIPQRTSVHGLSLRARRRRAGVCPRCGRDGGHWLACRRWECGGCGLQIGLRWDSVMEGSRLPLCTWFIAIGEVLADPAIRPERLQAAIGLSRSAPLGNFSEESWRPSSHPTSIVCWQACSTLRRERSRLSTVTRGRANLTKRL